MSGLYPVTIQSHKASTNKIFLGPEFFTHYRKGEVVTVQYGLEKTQAIVIPTKSSNVVTLSQNIWHSLALPFPHKIHVKAEGKKILLGPLVGIMTTGLRPHQTHPAGPRSKFYLNYLLCQKEVPSSYFMFSPADIQSSTRRVAGYFSQIVQGKRVWKRHLVPFPNVVYNRVFRRGEKMNFVKNGRAILEAAGTKIFNPFTFNKWKIHELIHHRSDVTEYLPESIINPSLRSLQALLNKHRVIYLKPAEGFLGLGIIQITKHPKKGVYSRFNSQGQNHLRLYPSLSGMIKHLFKGKSLKNYIAQQGIRLLQLNGRNIDFRVHANKDENGNWRMTGIAGKMSGRGSVTTHVRTGGHILSFESAMKKFFSPEKQVRIYHKLKTAVLTLAVAIEESLPGYVGEIGFDIGIDQTGHPWMFEANSQPGRHVFALPDLKESEVITRRNILDYSLFLSGFTKKDVYS